MSKYRIKKVTSYWGTKYIIQKRFMWFWYNPSNVDAYQTGVFDTMEGAKKEFEQLTFKNTAEYIELPILKG